MIPKSIQELMAPSGRTNRTKFRDQVLAPLLEAGLLEMTSPDKASKLEADDGRGARSAREWKARMTRVKTPRGAANAPRYDGWPGRCRPRARAARGSHQSPHFRRETGDAPETRGSVKSPERHLT
jgi:hypothetical protein